MLKSTVGYYLPTAADINRVQHFVDVDKATAAVMGVRLASQEHDGPACRLRHRPA